MAFVTVKVRDVFTLSILQLDKLIDWYNDFCLLGHRQWGRQWVFVLYSDIVLGN